MKLLIIGINFAPEIIAMGLYTTGLAEFVAKTPGDQVEVVTGHPYYPAWRRFDGYPRFGWKHARLVSGVNVVHCPHYVPSIPTGARRILHHASFALTSFPIMLWKAIRYRPDVVFLVAPAILPAPLVLLVSKLCGAKTWLHVQDFEVEAAFATGLLKEKSYLGRIANKFDRWVHSKFDRVSSISDMMLAKLRERGVEKEKIVEFRNWANLSVVRPMPEGSSPLLDEFGITSRHILLYSGNIANKQGLEMIPEIAKRLKHRTDLDILICGDGSFLPELKKLSEGCDNIKFFPLQPLDRLGDLLGMASVHFLPQIAGIADMVLPSKLTNMLASGRPVVATAVDGTALAGAVQGCGLTCKPGNADEAANAIESLINDDELRKELGTAARQRAYEQWDSAYILSRFSGQLHSLVNPNNISAPAANKSTSHEGYTK